MRLDAERAARLHAEYETKQRALEAARQAQAQQRTQEQLERLQLQVQEKEELKARVSKGSAGPVLALLGSGRLRRPCQGLRGEDMLTLQPATN